MSDSLENSVSVQKRQVLIKALPCFTMLSSEESHDLALSMIEKKYEANAEIVHEGDLIDSVYIIVEGQAEVAHITVNKKGKATRVPLALLNPGESIGLNDTGFFSTTGQRTASVFAITPMKVLCIPLKALHDFLKRHPHLDSMMHASASQMLRMQLIKQSLPFNRLSHQRLKWLAEQVEEVSFSKGTLIFSEGEEGDRSYLIRSGQIEIYTVNEMGEERRLAVLKSPTLFGEATFITHSPRNASARVLEDADLLMLEHRLLSELVETEKNIASTFMTLMVDRSRPLRDSEVLSHERTSPDGQLSVILKHPTLGHYFKLSKEGWFIWQKMDGKNTMQEITLALADEHNIFAPNLVAALISKLAKAGFLKQVEVESGFEQGNVPAWARLFFKIRQILEARIALGDADKFLSKVYRKWVHWLFTRPSQWVLTVVAILGIISFVFLTPHIMKVLTIIPHSWIAIVFISLIPLTILSVALHELGHAFATKAYGYEVHYMGVGWYWLAPVAFTDTSDMWLSTKWPRTAVNLAGIYTDLLTAGISSLLILVINHPFIQVLLWVSALYTYINAFRMLSPLQEMDGYYVLMDLVDKPHLRQSSVMWLVKEFPKSFRNPRLLKLHLPEIVYWLCCIVFLFLVSVMTYMVQTFVFKILGIQSGNIFVSLSLPILVALISSLGIIADIRSQSEE